MTPYYDKGGLTIYHGDALRLMSEMEDESLEIVFTDPPYSSGARQASQLRARKSMRRATGKHGEEWIGSDNMSGHGFTMLVRLFAVEALRLTKEGGHLFSFIDWRQWPVLAGAVEAAGWTIRACLVWDKEHYGMGNGFRQQAEFILHASKGTADNFVRHDLGTVFRASRHSLDAHPTMKPELVIGTILSAVPGETILDPFMGSGSTLRAAKDLGRKAIGIDNKKKWCELAVSRLHQEALL